MADTLDLESSAERCTGSTPVSRTKKSLLSLYMEQYPSGHKGTALKAERPVKWCVGSNPTCSAIADITQLVECQSSKLEVASSILVIRSKNKLVVFPTKRETAC